jgi:tellurite resistance protein
MEIRTSTIERLRDALLQSGTRAGPIKSSAYRVLVRDGLLSDLQKEALARVDAIAETMYLVVAANDEITEAELAAMRGAVRGLSGETLTDGIVQAMIETYAIKLRDDGRKARLVAIKMAMKDEMEALNAFALAAAAALADHRLDKEENELIQELKITLGLTNEQAESILGELHKDAD